MNEPYYMTETINSRNANLAAYQLDSYKSILFIFTPHIIPTQVVRPYMYNFNESNFSEFLIRNDTPEYGMLGAVGNTPMGVEATRMGCILPASGEGMSAVVLNTNDLSMKYTFLLVIDKPQHGGTSRFIASGYFGDEPINPNTMNMTEPTLNFNAMMVFTAHTIIRISKAYGPTASACHENLNVVESCAITPAAVVGMASGQELFFTDPCELRTHIATSGTGAFGKGIESWGDMAIRNNVKTYKATPTTVKSPMHHLRSIVQAIEAGKDITQRSSVGSSNKMGHALNDPFGYFTSSVAQNLATTSSRAILTNGFLDVSKPIALSTFDSKYPNTVVITDKIPHTSQWDVRPQTDITMQNTMSYLISQTVSMLANDNGILDIAFRYNSWQQATPFKPGAWQLFFVNYMADFADYKKKAALDDFVAMFEFDLIPIILNVAGHFDLMINYSSTGQTLIEFRLLDYNNNTNDGTIEMNGVLGGMNIPTLGNSVTVENNCKQLDTLIRDIGVNIERPSGSSYSPYGVGDVQNALPANYPMYPPNPTEAELAAWHDLDGVPNANFFHDISADRPEGN